MRVCVERLESSGPLHRTASELRRSSSPEEVHLGLITMITAGRQEGGGSLRGHSEVTQRLQGSQGSTRVYEESTSKETDFCR